MSREDDFLQAIRANPADEGLWLIYADWLEEQGDPRAQFIRLERAEEGVGLDRKRIRRRLLEQRMQKMGRTLDPEWVALLARSRIHNCGVRWAFRCPQRWDRLTLTGSVEIRHCSVCDRNVHYCRSADAARTHASAGHCVALDIGVSCSTDLSRSLPLTPTATTALVGMVDIPAPMSAVGGTLEMPAPPSVSATDGDEGDNRQRRKRAEIERRKQRRRHRNSPD